MNLYVRYFNKEALVATVEEAVEFLQSIQDIRVDQNMIARIRTFVEGASVYPYHLKVSYSNYVIIIKTEAASMEQFKEFQAQKDAAKDVSISQLPVQDRKRTVIELLNEERQGWYEAKLVFKRVVLIPETSKFQYKDTVFSVRCIANSGMHCYNRIVEHLRSRQDVDPRSQFPSAKSANFQFKFLESTQATDNPTEQNEE